MKFSERYGYKKIEETILKESIPDIAKVRIWNIFSVFLQDIGEHYISEKYINFVNQVWDSYFKSDIEELRRIYENWGPRGISSKIKEKFYDLKWYEVYDFIEFFIKHAPDRYIAFLKDKINSVLKEEKLPYNLIEEQIVPLISQVEIEEVEKALNVPYKNVHDHLNKALSLLSDRKEPDYPNSIKESICALESLVQILLGEKGTLGDLIKKLDVHPALKQGFSNLYGWTSDEGGIRHGRVEENFKTEIAEARYMLVTTSAFINYTLLKFNDKDHI